MSKAIVPIILKVLQVVLLVAGLGCVAFFTKEVSDQNDASSPDITDYEWGRYGRLEFYLQATGMGIIISVCGIVLAAMGMLNKNHFALAMVAVQGVWVLQLLAATSLLSKLLAVYSDEDSTGSTSSKSLCETWDDTEDRDYKYTCGQLMGGVITGFLAMILYAVDVAISTVSLKKAT